MIPKALLGALLLGGAYMPYDSMGSSKRATTLKKDMGAKWWSKRSKRMKMQKESRKINRK